MRWHSLGYVAFFGFVGLCLAIAPPAPFISSSGGCFRQQQVGGVSIDPSGVLKNTTVDERGEIKRELEKALHQAPGDMAGHVELRKISLRGLEAAIAESLKTGAALPDEVLYLAGMQRVRYVFAVPEEQDVILAGPAEGWRVGPGGDVVGANNSQPVMLLDDLLSALRTVDAARQGGLSCSIDPTPEGMRRLQPVVSQAASIPTPDEASASERASEFEEALGPQTITVWGVDPRSHFARVMVAADYRMKRIAMGFEPAPIRGLPSYLSMVKGNGRGMQNMMPRWWLATNYEGVLEAPDKMAFEIRGAGVKCLVEEEFLDAQGKRQGSGKASAPAKQWATAMTNKFNELSAKEAIFGQLRNCMDLAVTAALISKEHLFEKAGCQTPLLLSGSDLPTAQFNAPKHVASQASLLRKSSSFVITVSGGVEVDSWGVLKKTEPSEKVAAVRGSLGKRKSWWWD